MTTTSIPAEIAEAVPGLFPPKPLGLLPDPAEIPGIILSLGLKPSWESFMDYDDKGRLCGVCALTAVYCVKVPGGHQEVLAGRWRVGPGAIVQRLGISWDVQDGACQGFDGQHPDYSEPFPGTQADFNAAYAWGKAARDACVAAGLTSDIAIIDEEAAAC